MSQGQAVSSLSQNFEPPLTLKASKEMVSKQVFVNVRKTVQGLQACDQVASLGWRQA